MRLPGHDQVAQLAVVALHRALAGAHALALGEELAVLPRDPPLLRELVRRARIFRQVDADDADRAGRAHDLDQPVEHELRVLLARGVVYVADARDPAVDLATVRLDDLLDRVAVREVDRLRADRFGQPQAVRLLVHDEDAARAADERAVGRHQPDRARAEDGYGVARADLAEDGAVVAGREDVAEHREVELVLVARR